MNMHIKFKIILKQFRLYKYNYLYMYVYMYIIYNIYIHILE